MTGCGDIGKLTSLYLSGNRLPGSLLNSYVFFILDILNSFDNMLSGKINVQLDGLVNMRILNVGYNQFVVLAPTHFGKSIILE